MVESFEIWWTCLWLFHPTLFDLNPITLHFEWTPRGRAFGSFISVSPWLAVLCGWRGKASKGKIQHRNGMSIWEIWFIFPSTHLIFSGLASPLCSHEHVDSPEGLFGKEMKWTYWKKNFFLVFYFLSYLICFPLGWYQHNSGILIKV